MYNARKTKKLYVLQFDNCVCPFSRQRYQTDFMHNSWANFGIDNWNLGNTLYYLTPGKVLLSWRSSCAFTAAVESRNVTNAQPVKLQSQHILKLLDTILHYLPSTITWIYFNKKVNPHGCLQLLFFFIELQWYSGLSTCFSACGQEFFRSLVWTGA